MKTMLIDTKTNEVIFRDMTYNQMMEAIRDGFFVNPFIPQDREYTEHKEG